jgi:hypothetical protein
MASTSVFVADFVRHLTGVNPEETVNEKQSEILRHRLTSAYKICIKYNIVGQRRNRETPPKPFIYEQHRFGGQKIKYWCLRLDDALRILRGEELSEKIENAEELNVETQKQNVDSGGGGIHPQIFGSNGSAGPPNSFGSNVEQDLNLGKSEDAEFALTKNPNNFGGPMDPTDPQNRGVYGGSGENEVFEKSAETAESGGGLNAGGGGGAVSLVAALRNEEVKKRLEEAKAAAARMSMFAARYRSAIKCYMEKLMETMSRSEARKRAAEVIKNEDVEELRRVGCL